VSARLCLTPSAIDEVEPPVDSQRFKSPEIKYLQDILNRVTKFQKDETNLVERIQLKFQEELIERSTKLSALEGLVRKTLHRLEHQTSAPKTAIPIALIDDIDTQDTRLDGPKSPNDNITSVLALPSPVYEPTFPGRGFPERVIKSDPPITKVENTDRRRGRAIRTMTRPSLPKSLGLDSRQTTKLMRTNPSVPSKKSILTKDTSKPKGPAKHTISRSSVKVKRWLSSSTSGTTIDAVPRLSIAEIDGPTNKIYLWDHTLDGHDDNLLGKTTKMINAFFSVDPNQA